MFRWVKFYWFTSALYLKKKSSNLNVDQVYVILQPPSSPQSSSLVTSILVSNCLQYSNSAMNPLLYAGLSDNFRKSFRKVIIITEASSTWEACENKWIATAGVSLRPILARPEPTAKKLLLHHKKNSSGSPFYSGASGRLFFQDGGQGGPIHPCHLNIFEVPEQHCFWGSWFSCCTNSNNHSCCQRPTCTTTSSCLS